METFEQNGPMDKIYIIQGYPTRLGTEDMKTFEQNGPKDKIYIIQGYPTRYDTEDMETFELNGSKFIYIKYAMIR